MVEGGEENMRSVLIYKSREYSCGCTTEGGIGSLGEQETRTGLRMTSRCNVEFTTKTLYKGLMDCDVSVQVHE